VIRISPAYPSPLDAPALVTNETERLFVTSGAGIAMTLAHLNHHERNTTTTIIHTSRHRQEFALLNRLVRDRRYNIKQALYYDTSQGIKSRLRAINQPPNATTTASRFNPAGHPQLSQCQGRIYYCGGEALGNALEKALQPLDKALIKDKFSF
jgi:ferredoxin-NADP reductase